jgi:hypothetical protein
MKHLKKIHEYQNKISEVSKKTILIIAILITPFIGNSQTIVFNKYDGNPEVTTIVVSKKAFELMAKFGGASEEAEEYASMIGGLDGLKVFTTESISIAKEMKETVDAYLISANLSELMRVNDKEANVRIYIREGKDDDHVEELLMFVNGLDKHFEEGGDRSAEAVIVSLTGDIDLEKIAELTEDLNISGSEHLKKAGN